MIAGIFATLAIFSAWQGILNLNRSHFARHIHLDREGAKYTAYMLIWNVIALGAAFLSGVYV